MEVSIYLFHNVPLEEGISYWCVVCGRHFGATECNFATVARVRGERRPPTGGGPYWSHPWHSDREIKEAARKEFLIASGEL